MSTHWLLFQIGWNWYAVELSSIEEVIPFLPGEAISNKDLPGFLGFLHYRKEHLLVVDLNYVLHQKYSAKKMDSRIVVYKTTLQGHEVYVGFVVERMTRIITKESNEIETVDWFEESSTFKATRMFWEQGQPIYCMILDTVFNKNEKNRLLSLHNELKGQLLV